MNLAQKQEVTAELRERFSTCDAVFLVNCSGCTCEQLTRVRRELHASGARFAVVKNTLAERAVSDTNANLIKGLFKGPVAVVWTGKDSIGSAKVLVKFAKSLERFSLKGGVFEGRVVENEELEALAALPSKEQLYGKLLGVINAPAIRLLRTISAPASSLARVLEAWRGQLEKMPETGS